MQENSKRKQMLEVIQTCLAASFQLHTIDKCELKTVSHFISNHQLNIKTEDVLGYRDRAMLGTGKKGHLITENFLAYSYDGKSTSVIAFDNITNVTSDRKKIIVTHRDGSQNVFGTAISTYAEYFSNLINAFIKIRNSSNDNEEKNVLKERKVSHKILLTFEDGSQVDYEFLDSIEYGSDDYVIVAPLYNFSGDVEIFCVSYNEYGDEICEPVDNPKILQAVFEIFKENNKGIYKFADEEPDELDVLTAQMKERYESKEAQMDFKYTIITKDDLKIPDVSFDDEVFCELFESVKEIYRLMHRDYRKREVRDLENYSDVFDAMAFYEDYFQDSNLSTAYHLYKKGLADYVFLSNTQPQNKNAFLLSCLGSALTSKALITNNLEEKIDYLKDAVICCILGLEDDWGLPGLIATLVYLMQAYEQTDEDFEELFKITSNIYANILEKDMYTGDGSDESVSKEYFGKKYLEKAQKTTVPNEAYLKKAVTFENMEALSLLAEKKNDTERRELYTQRELLSLLQTIEEFPAANEFYFQEGCKYYRNKEYDNAFECFDQAIEYGDEEETIVYAKYNLGIMLFRKFYDDAETMITCFEDASKGGLKKAPLILTHIYFEQKKYDEATQWIQKASKDHPVTLYYLEKMYRNGYGVKPNILVADLCREKLDKYYNETISSLV